MKTTLALALAAALALTAGATAMQKGADELVGGYTIVSGEKFGRPEPPERVEGATVRITADRIVVTDKDKKEVYGVEYTIDGSTSPYKIKMVSKLAPKEETSVGLIEKKGDTVRLIYALPGGAEPTGFKTGEKQLMFVMKNERKGASKAATKTVD